MRERKISRNGRTIFTEDPSKSGYPPDGVE